MIEVDEIIKGNEAAFKEFFEQTHGKAYHFALKHTQDEVTAQDIVQSAYVIIWEKRANIQPIYLAFKSYLYTSIRNLIIAEYRRKVTSREADVLFQALQPINESAQEVSAHALEQEVKTMVATLPQKQQQAFRLVKFEGLTYEEAAEVMSISKSTVEKHIIQALRTLRKNLSHLAYLLL